MRHRNSKNFINSDDLCACGMHARMVRRAIGESIDRKFEVNAIAAGSSDHNVLIRVHWTYLLLANIIIKLQQNMNLK